MRIFVLLYLLCFECSGICDGLPTATLVQAIKYGVAWESYWNVSYNDLSADASARTLSMLAAQGSVVRVAVWKADSDARKSDSVYYVEQAASTNPPSLPRFMIYSQGSRVTAIDFGIRNTNASPRREFLTVRLPSDLRKEATQFSAQGLTMLTNLQVGLQGMLRVNKAKGKQHFFVGPFIGCSPKVVIFWLERKKLIETGPPDSSDAEILTSQLVTARYSDVDIIKRGQQVGDKLQAKSEELFWINKWVANCVLDGKLLELKTP